MLGLYLHFPFCKQKCFHCSFYSEVFDSQLFDKYIRFLEKEIMQLKMKGYLSDEFDTLYIGGGSPSLSYKNLLKVLDMVFKKINFVKNFEFTIEVNPEDINLDLVKVFRDYGINRISIGLQSIFDDELKAFGRRYSFSEIRENIYFIMENFENVNIDLIFGLPNSNLRRWEKVLKEVGGWGVKHISTYEFKPKYDVKNLPNESEILEMYKLRDEILPSFGFKRYEISNYSLEGYECKHNLIYWRHENYLGLGPGASSFMKSRRWKNSFLSQYLKGNFVQFEEFINDERWLMEEIFLKLRLTEGLNIENLFQRFDKSLDKNLLLFLIDNFGEYLNINNTTITLNLNGVLVADKISFEIFEYFKGYLLS